MNLNDLKISGRNMLSVTDALNMPLLKLKINVNESTIVPSLNELRIFVDKSENETSDRKTYIFSLNEVLGINDEFVITPSIDRDKVSLKTYVLRNGEKEFIPSKKIILFEGVNYISTNYINADIDIVYPKNVDLVNLFLNNTLYEMSDNNIYFKDCFTLDDEKINAEFNSLKVNCISSNNNSFRIDENGNITCNKITCTDSNILDKIYPVGSIYMSVNDILPSDVFGGVWEKIKDRFLLASGDNYQLSSVGGSAQIQSHSHIIPVLSGTTSTNGSHSHVLSRRTTTYAAGTQTNYRAIASPLSVKADYDEVISSEASGSHTHTFSTNQNVTSVFGTGDSGNMPPYLTVNVWKRVS